MTSVLLVFASNFEQFSGRMLRSLFCDVISTDLSFNVMASFSRVVRAVSEEFEF